MELAREALGLGRDDIGGHGLARAAVAHSDGVARHTAALALAGLAESALGLRAIDEAVATMRVMAPQGRHWRYPQALAQMKAARFKIPQISLLLSTQVNAIHGGIQLYESRWLLGAQIVGAGLGGGIGLLFIMSLLWLPVILTPTLPSAEHAPGIVATYLLLGGMAGVFFSGMRGLSDVLANHRLARVLGGGLGFALAIAALVPFMDSTARLMLGKQILFGLFVGAAIAVGWEFEGYFRERTTTQGAALGGAVSGALGFAVAWYVAVPLPFALARDASSFLLIADQQLLAWFAIGLAAITGAVLGAGMAGGGAAGRAFWERFRGTA